MLYPIMTTSRELIDLNGIWKFKLDHGIGFVERWFEHALQETVPMPVPASYNDLYEGAEFRDHIGWVWYEREIIIPGHFFNQRIVLRFGSVTHAAKVYLNGQFVVEHKGGFTPFEAEINVFVSCGKNHLTVAVNTIVDYTTLPLGNYKEEDVPGKGKVVTNTPNFDFFNLHLNFGTMLGGEVRAHKTWEELGTKEHHADMIRELIARDKNHPCVVMWSIANEPASEEEGAYEYLQPLVQLARDLDPQKRPVTIVTHMMATPDTCKVSGLVDVLALNWYYG